VHSKKTGVKRCENPEVSSPLLEATVFEMVKQTMLDPMTSRPRLDQVNETRQATERRLDVEDAEAILAAGDRQWCR